MGLDQKSTGLEAGVDPFDQLRLGRVDLTCFTIGNQVECLHETDPADITNNRVTVLQFQEFPG